MIEQGLSAWHPQAQAQPSEDAPAYPATSECWACGTVQVVVDRLVSMRRCSGSESAPHDEVTWKDELMPGATGDAARNARAAEKSLAEIRERFGPRNNDLEFTPHNID